MTSPLRTLFWIACAAAMLVGLLLTLSPWLVDGGFLGWINGLEYSREADVLMISSAASFTLGLVSATIGIVIMLAAGVVAIATGLVASLVRLTKAASQNKTEPR